MAAKTLGTNFYYFHLNCRDCICTIGRSVSSHVSIKTFFFQKWNKWKLQMNECRNKKKLYHWISLCIVSSSLLSRVKVFGRFKILNLLESFTFSQNSCLWHCDGKLHLSLKTCSTCKKWGEQFCWHESMDSCIQKFCSTRHF